MNAFDDFTDVAHAGARCSIHFHDVHMAAFHDGHAVFAFTTRFGCWAAVAVFTDAVHAFGDDPRGGGFTRSANARHDERLRDTIGSKGIFQGADHRVLSDEIGKRFGAVFAGKDLIGRGFGFAHVQNLSCPVANVHHYTLHITCLLGGNQVREQPRTAPSYNIDRPYPVFLMPVLANPWDIC